LKNVVILGSTGSIGRSTIEIIRNDNENFNVVGLACASRIDELSGQLKEFPLARFSVRDPDAMQKLLSQEPALEDRAIGTGDDSLVELVEEMKPDIVINALVGISGLRPTISALENNIKVACANKETIVTGGEYIYSRFKNARELIIPVDSEHFSLSRCFRGYRDDVVEVIITASGGPFYGKKDIDLDRVSVEEVLNHPTWDMGRKVTVDSASLFNKGLEVIEAHWLFDFPLERIKVLIHPQSVVHSAVRLRDGSLIAHMAPCDMRLPIVSALYHPEVVEFPWGQLGFEELSRLEFVPLEKGMFPAFDLAVESAHRGGTSPVVLSTADEVAVDAFLNGRISFAEIVNIIGEAIEKHEVKSIESLDDIFLADEWTRSFLKKKLGNFG